MAATKHETRPLWCGFGLVTNILQSLKTAFDDQPNFLFLSLIPFFLIVLLCTTLKWMLSFTGVYAFQIFAVGFLSCLFCQLVAKDCVFKTISSKVSHTTLLDVFCWLFLIFFSYDNTFQLFQPSNFSATKSTNSFLALQYNALVFAFINTLPFQSFTVFLGLIRYCSFLGFFTSLDIIAQYYYLPTMLACNFYFDFCFVIFCQYFMSPFLHQRFYFSLLTAVCITSKFICEFDLFAAWPWHY